MVNGDLKFATPMFETSLADSSGTNSQEIPRQQQIVFAYPEGGDGESQEESRNRSATTEFPQTMVSKTADLRYGIRASHRILISLTMPWYLPMVPLTPKIMVILN